MALSTYGICRKTSQEHAQKVRGHYPEQRRLDGLLGECALHGKRTRQFARSRQWRHTPRVCVHLTDTFWRSRAYNKLSVTVYTKGGHFIIILKFTFFISNCS